MPKQNMQQDQKDGSKQSGLSWTTPASATQHKPATPPTITPPPTKSGASVSSAAGKSPSSARYIGMVVVGVIAGIVIAWGWVALRPESSEVASTGSTQTQNTVSSGTNTATNGAAVPGLGSDPGLTVLSPQPAGSSVAIDKAIVSVPTWIVVYESNNGEPGNALGAALFFPEGQRGTVELLRATVSGKTYLVVKQTDNGDRRFSLRDDEVLSEGGEVQWVSFQTR